VERKAKKDGDSQKQIKLIYGADGQSESAHHGPVYSVSRNYFLPKCIVSVGDWMARIWTEDIKTAIMSTRYESHYLTSGTWSPTRPGVFYVTKRNGQMDVWDYYYKGQFEPAYTVKISEQYALSDIAISNKSQGKYVGIGCADGSVTIMELCRSLYQSTNLNAEKQAITQLFERESNREKGLQAAKLAQRRAAKLAQSKKQSNSKAKMKKQVKAQSNFDLTDFSLVEDNFMNFIKNNQPKKIKSKANEQNKENDDGIGNE